VRDPRSTLSWLSVVARREAIRAVNKERRVDPVGDTVVFDRPLDGEDPQSIVERRMRRETVLRNLAKLPARRRELLCVMFLSEADGYAEIAEMLDMPVGSIGPTRQRSLSMLRRFLDADKKAEHWRSA
jgi:RNA polymerase sigma factor (sigma-70 family)